MGNTQTKCQPEHSSSPPDTSGDASLGPVTACMDVFIRGTSPSPCRLDTGLEILSHRTLAPDTRQVTSKTPNLTMASHQLLATAAAILVVQASAQDQPLLSSIALIPELSTFSSVVNGSGGSRLNPALEERFNSALDGRNYTALVPTNDVSQATRPLVVAPLVVTRSDPTRPLPRYPPTWLGP